MYQRSFVQGSFVIDLFTLKSLAVDFCVPEVFCSGSLRSRFIFVLDSFFGCGFLCTRGLLFRIP